MKKFLLLTWAVIAAFSLNSCSKDDDGKKDDPSPETVHVTQSGTLKELLRKQNLSEATSLTITGVLNENDFNTLHEMTFKTLKNIDLKGVENITNLSKDCFANATKLQNITLPSTLVTIEACAFAGCEVLTNVTFEQGSQLKTIKSSAFCDCPSLTSIEIPASLEIIEIDAFNGCEALELVNMSACTQVKKIEEYVFSNCSNLRLFEIGTITPPEAGWGIFNDCPDLAILKVPAESIEAYKQASGWNKFSNISALD